MQSGECALPAAEEAAASMRELLEFVRSALPATRIVVLAPLPKGDYWPNRCTPAFDLFFANLQVIPCSDLPVDHCANTWPPRPAKAPLQSEGNNGGSSGLMCAYLAPVV